MVSFRSEQSGYIALLTVLVVGAIATAVALTLLIGGVNNSRTTLVEQESAQARALAQACAEEGLQQLHANTSYIGTGTVSLATGTCTYTVTGSTGTRSILATSTVQNVVRKIQVYATITSSSISITSWQEVI